MNEVTVKTEYGEKEIRFLINKAYKTKEMKKRLIIAAVLYFLAATIMSAYSFILSFEDKPLEKILMLGFALILFLLGIFKKKVSMFVSYKRYQKAIAKNKICSYRIHILLKVTVSLLIVISVKPTLNGMHIRYGDNSMVSSTSYEMIIK